VKHRTAGSRTTRLAIMACIFGISTPAWAYLDPGTGSMLLQGLIGSIAVAGAFFARFREQIGEFMARLFRRRE
jgi:hypothetical protein